LELELRCGMCASSKAQAGEGEGSGLQKAAAGRSTLRCHGSLPSGAGCHDQRVKSTRKGPRPRGAGGVDSSKPPRAAVSNGERTTVDAFEAISPEREADCQRLLSPGSANRGAPKYCGTTMRAIV